MRIILSVILAMCGLVFASSSMSATYVIDPSHTYPSFEISHLGFSTMRGRFNKTSGSIQMDLKKKTGSVDISIDASSIDTAHAKRDKHLSSPDFLNAAEFPKITYKSSKVTFTGDKTAKVDGTLTILGVAKPVTLTVTSIGCGKNPFNKKDTCGFDAHATIKRSDFGIKYGLPAIGDEMKLLIEAEGVKQ